MNEFETVVKVLVEKIQSLELNYTCAKYTIENLKKEIDKLKAEIEAKEKSENE